MMTANYEPDRIFVGGLPNTVDSNEKLLAFFQQFGPVKESKVFVELGTGRPKGFGFVSFEHEASVDAAIANDAQNVIDGKWVSVKRCEVGGKGKAPGGTPVKWQGAANSVEDAGLWVRGLPLDFTETTLKQFFGQYGHVVDCKILPRRYPNNPDQAGLVRMAAPDQAQWCVDNLNNTTPPGFGVALTVRRSSKSGGPKSRLDPMMGAYGGGMQQGQMMPLQNPGAPSHSSLPADSASSTLWVKGLPLGFTDSNLRELFSAYGVVTDCQSLPQQFSELDGVVCMSSQEGAQVAVATLNGQIPMGFTNPISVTFAKESSSSQTNDFGQPNPVIVQPPPHRLQALGLQDPNPAPMQQAQAMTHHGQKVQEPDRIWIGGLPHTCDMETLALFFSQFGGIKEASVNVDQATGRSKGFGFVRFVDPKSVEMAIHNDVNNVIDGKYVAVKRAEVASGGGPHSGHGGASTLALTTQPTAQLDGNTSDTGLWIRGLPLHFNESSLKSWFEQYVEVIDCKLLPRRFPQNPDQAGLVRVASGAMAKWCIDSLNGTTPPGFPIPVTVKLSTSTAPPHKRNSGGGGMQQGYTSTEGVAPSQYSFTSGGQQADMDPIMANAMAVGGNLGDTTGMGGGAHYGSGFSPEISTDQAYEGGTAGADTMGGVKRPGDWTLDEEASKFLKT